MTINMLDFDTFLGVVNHTPLVAVDLVMVRGGQEVLLGLRNNRPAQGFWFVPGGRILKNEHFYPDSFAGSAAQVGVSTHYVVLGHVLHLSADFAVPSCDAQHAELRWWPLADALASELVHGFTKDYLVDLN